MRRNRVVAALLIAVALTGCSAGFRIDHAPAGAGLDAEVQGPGEAVVLRDRNGEALVGMSVTFNPVAIIENLGAMLASQWGKLTGSGPTVTAAPAGPRQGA